MKNRQTVIRTLCFFLLSGVALQNNADSLQTPSPTAGAKTPTTHTTDNFSIGHSLAVSSFTPTSTRLIIKLKSSVQKTQALQRFQLLSNKYPFRISKRFKSSAEIAVIDTEATQTQFVLQQLQRDNDIEYVERDQAIELRTISNDTRFNELWALNENDQDSDINAQSAWDITTGTSDAVIAVVDSGVAYSHFDLRHNMWRNPGEIPGDGVDNDNNGVVDDIYGFDAGDDDADPYDDINHGSYVAGVIGAEGNNAALISGINWTTSILACKIFSSKAAPVNGFVSSALACLDYIWDLKQNHAINIIATNNSWGWKGPVSRALKESIERQKEAGILFLVAAGNDGRDNDSGNDNPSSYSNSNIISVASYNQFNLPSTFSNYGAHSVHISAPGEAILSTSPGSVAGGESLAPDNAVFFDGLENGISQWLGDNNWKIDSNAYAGAQALMFSPASGGVSSPITLVGLSPIPTMVNSALDFSLNISAADYSLNVETSTDGNTWTVITNIAYEPNLSWRNIRVSIPNPISSSGYLLRFTPGYNSTDTPDFFIAIDEVSLVPQSQRVLDNALRYSSGTSMSSPAVAGAIALLYAQDPSRTWVQLKNLILAGGKPFNTGNTETISNRRLRLSDTNGSGSLTCVNQSLQKQLLPRRPYYLFSTANPIVHLEYLSILCENPDGPVSVRVLENGNSYELADDGKPEIDQSANDGVFSAKINLLELGLDHVSLIFPNGEHIDAYLSGSYFYNTAIPYLWRDILDPVDLHLNDIANDPAYINSPFPLKIGTKEYSQLYVSLHGFISFFYPIRAALPTFINTELPNNEFDAAIAILWNDYANIDAMVSYGINGAAPNRELIVQWNVAPFDATNLGANHGLFQTVLFENSSDILLNYQDAIFNLASYDNGNSSTVGVQTSSIFANQYNSLALPIASNSSILWQYDNGPYVDASNLLTNPPTNTGNSSNGSGTAEAGGENTTAEPPSSAKPLRRKSDSTGYFGFLDLISVWMLFMLLANKYLLKLST